MLLLLVVVVFLLQYTVGSDFLSEVAGGWREEEVVGIEEELAGES